MFKYYLTKIKGSETIKLINMCGFFTISKKNSSIRRGWLVKLGFVKHVQYFYNNEYIFTTCDFTKVKQTDVFVVSVLACMHHRPTKYHSPLSFATVL